MLVYSQVDLNFAFIPMCLCWIAPLHSIPQLSDFRAGQKYTLLTAHLDFGVNLWNVILPSSSTCTVLSLVILAYG